MAAALRGLRAEYPDPETGLPRSMTLALDALRDGPHALSEAFRRMQAKEAAAFMGDWSFARLIDELAQARRPLLEADFGSGLLDPLMHGARPDRAWFAQTARLTAFGEAVMDRDVDAIAVNGVDRWIGGVHLTGYRCWRYAAVDGALAVA